MNRLEAWRKCLQDHGVSIEKEEKWPKRGKSLYFRDPARNLVERVTPGIWGGCPVGGERSKITVSIISHPAGQLIVGQVEVHFRRRSDVQRCTQWATLTAYWKSVEPSWRGITRIAALFVNPSGIGRF